MIYNSHPDWKMEALKDVIIFNPEEVLLNSSVVKHVNLDRLTPYNKFINGFDSVEYTGKGSKFRNRDVLVPQISSGLIGGKTALVTILDEGEIGVGSSWFIVFRSIVQVTDPDFLYYLAITPWFKESAIKTLEGSTHSQYVNINILKDIKFPIPPYEEQLLIADTLSSIDDKIKKNSEVCSAIEKILDRLFYDWFIEYNFPGKHGSPYKISGGKFFKSDMGLIPDGWKIGCLAEIGNIVSGATPSKKVDAYYTPNGIPWITPKDLSRLGTKFVYKGAVDITEEGVNSCGTSRLPCGTVLFSSRAPIGYIAIAENELTTNQGFRSIIPFPDIGSTFVYYLLLSKTQEITNMASGSTFKEISGQSLKKLKIVIPDVSVLQAFEEQTNHLMRYQKNLEKESDLLASMQSNLLPMLMAGTVRIPARG